MYIYHARLKNREFDKEAPQNSCPERVTIAGRQGTSEDKNSEEKPTPSKPDFSGCFGINRRYIGILFILLYCVTSAVSFVFINQYEKNFDQFKLAFYVFLFAQLFFSGFS